MTTTRECATSNRRYKTLFTASFGAIADAFALLGTLRPTKIELVTREITTYHDSNSRITVFMLPTAVPQPVPPLLL